MSTPGVATTVGSIQNQSITERLAQKGLEDDDQVCSYKPRVQVLDNWGWCNGTCNGSSGCYNDTQRGVGPACDNPQQQGVDPWTEFNGQIIVIPNEEFR